MILQTVTRVKKAITELQNGKMIILTDHPDRENEGDFIFPAEIITPDVINFMIHNGSGIVCLSLFDVQLKKMGLQYMVSPHENSSRCGTPFTVSIEAKIGVTTGVSAQDRTTTILTAINSTVSENDIAKPGHVFPLCAKQGGVLERKGHTEGAIDIVRIAGFQSGAVLCEVMNPDGTMAKGKKLLEFAKKNNIMLLSIEEIIMYRRYNENLILDEVTTQLPLANYGNVKFSVIKEKYTHHEHIVLMNEKENNKNTLVRIHSACLTGDLFGSQRCDCYHQLHFSLERISDEGGIIIYLNQEGRGIGLFNKIKSYILQDNGLNTIEANLALDLPVDAREYYIAANILRNKNVNKVRLLTNNPDKVSGLQKYGIADVDMVLMPPFYNDFNTCYLNIKRTQFNHQIQSI